MDQIFNLAAIGTGTFLIMLIWIMVWKGWALWIAAQKQSKPWFIALLIVNTLGILEILYIFIFSKKNKKSLEKDGEIVVEIETNK